MTREEWNKKLQEMVNAYIAGVGIALDRPEMEEEDWWETFEYAVREGLLQSIRPIHER